MRAKEFHTVTITLSPETEARLRARAEREQQDIDALADALLADALAEDPDDLPPEAVAEIRAGIRRGLEDCGAGRVQPLSRWAAGLRQEFRLPPHLTDEQLAREQC
jgi:hypothetical protein